ncbi:Adenylate cyclase 1 [Falsiruegeria litorea R37]|uniref:Adenylate cyclase 1 n=1 Tax=Falsiruegeria litorea R37 TaxID=1200284 RepID=A0A1Y5S9U4_9RHOB|nr:adenylate/guanylate cyclase domain-containing protein [Falsiruegeria litorea]SLN35076.1 Adenylate cyclase 1 [Falsiruegeria litorea R37]
MPTPTDLNRWLISDGRLLGDEIAIVRGYCQALVDMGVPLARVRVAQQYSNPILSAWGIIWTPQNTEKYVVPSTILDTSAWKGSPFEHVITTRTSLRKRIMDLNLAHEHDVYAELAAGGATDFFAMALEYGDGSVQGTSLTTHHPDGFSDADIQAFEDTRQALAAAMEPIAMRESQDSLLRTYLGDGPAVEIGDGHIKRGENTSVSAAILIADLRGFTAKSEAWPEAKLLTVMGDYFDMIVTAVRDQGGDVLKFMGDGVLAIFRDDDANRACTATIKAAEQALAALESYNQCAQEESREQIAFVLSADFGPVTFGNIGSPDRLDYTVVGPPVNMASRVQALCKNLHHPALFTAAVAQHAQAKTASIGPHDIRGVADPVELFRL